MSDMRRQLHDRLDSFPNDTAAAKERKISDARRALHKRIDSLRAELDLWVVSTRQRNGRAGDEAGFVAAYSLARGAAGYEQSPSDALRQFACRTSGSPRGTHRRARIEAPCDRRSSRDRRRCAPCGDDAYAASVLSGRLRALRGGRAAACAGDDRRPRRLSVHRVAGRPVAASRTTPAAARSSSREA